MNIAFPSYREAESARRLEALLDISRSLAVHQEFGALLGALDACLRKVVEYDNVVLLLYDAVTEAAWTYFPDACMDRMSNVVAFPFIDGPGHFVWKHQLPAVNSLADLEREYPKVYRLRLCQRTKWTCTLPLTTVHQRLGVMEFATSREEAYAPEDVHFMQLVAAQVATAVDNALVYERLKSSEDALAHERDHLRTLLDVTNTAVSRLHTRELIGDVSTQIERLLGAEFCGLVLRDPVDDSLRWDVAYCRGGGGSVGTGIRASMSGPVLGRAFRDRTTLSLCRRDMEELAASCEFMGALEKDGIRSLCVLPLINRGSTIGILVVGQIGREVFDDGVVRLLEEIAGQVTMSVANTLAYREIERLRDKLASEKLYLEEEIKAQYNFDEIIGESAKLKAVLDQVQMVADTDTSVLILGETGTGKELIARAIHNLSGRSERTLVKINCAAIPSELLESDLFGHEKGAFSGATVQKIGRFELAHQGTLFLDEIGDVPLELQPKLLRALQEHELERVGSVRSVHIDVRVIAATNRNLKQMIAERQFRSDLYYRLNVFPIFVPPLRERPEDIPLLVRHFVRKYAKKMQRDITDIPAETMTALARMPWLGNVRELEHLIERAVILSRGSTLQVPLEAAAPRPLQAFDARNIPAAEPRVPTLEDIERNSILVALRETRGQVGGANGAAARLGIKRTTLLSKMKRLGIVRAAGPSTEFNTRH
ncbi:sigma 54-interacting transcriptional regulator [Xanthobacteraceae bacterium Astr-EGSB]|uniref:sigma 54-interacting transcriptional regulator n=1 Tax=Astrobacterium formosum TaxID=3069710 RepID=UPI0027AFD413|nr:sigma 54-interacting transcriptional regulator [Xanthobacteraceae bacterium Astr-EGSB]